MEKKPCICSKEADIAAIRTKVDDLHKIINGNGQPGLRETVPRLTAIMEQVIERMDRAESRQQQTEEKKDDTKKFHVSTIIAIAAVTIALLALILK